MAENMTNRQLAEMMANGWGEWMHNPSHSGVVYSTYKYLDVESNWPLAKNADGQEIVVRKFGESNWQFPKADLYLNFLEERNDKFNYLSSWLSNIEERVDFVEQRVKVHEWSIGD